MIEILYSENTDMFGVELRKWTDTHHSSRRDVILELWYVDGGYRNYTYERFDPYAKTDAEMIRYAIAKYDEMVNDEHEVAA